MRLEAEHERASSFRLLRQSLPDSITFGLASSRGEVGSGRKQIFFSNLSPFSLCLLLVASEPDLWALSNATSSACIVPMVSGLDWVGLGGSAAAVVGVN